MKELITIQTKLKAPKGLFNKFGNYKYRSLEGILESLKPLLDETRTAIIFKDDIFFMEGCFYITSKCSLYREDGSLVAETSSLAREPREQKGMNDAQISGSTSSYCRKYAVSALLALDDNADQDHLVEPSKEKKVALSPSKADVKAFYEKMVAEGLWDYTEEEHRVKLKEGATFGLFDHMEKSAVAKKASEEAN